MEKKKEIAQPIRKTALAQLAERLNVPSEVMKETLKSTAFKECKTDSEFLAAVIVANTYRLNPLLKEMYAFPAKGGGIIPIISIDGFISLANRHPEFDGVELIENEEDNHPGNLKSVTAKFYLKSKKHPVVVTEYMDECYNDSKEPWKRWPRRMLRHKAYIQGARVAFGFSGLYDQDEAERIIDVTGKPQTIKEPEAITEHVQEQQPPQTQPDGYKAMLEEFAVMKKQIGEEKYYAVLTWNNLEHSNQIKDLETGRKILAEMRMNGK